MSKISTIEASKKYPERPCYTMISSGEFLCVDWNSSDVIFSFAKTGTAMAVVAVPVPSTLVSNHNAMTPMGLVVQQNSWLLPHNVNQYRLVGYCHTM